MTFENYNFAGKRALVRVDFNVPLNDEREVTDNTRIKAALPTIQKIIKDEGSVVIMSHLGRPKGERKPELSLKHIVPELSALLGKEVLFVEDCIGEKATAQTTLLKAGEVALLENVRYYKEETMGMESFAKQLAEHGDVYVNDAFGTAHRAHASTTVVAGFFGEGQKMFGYLLQDEINSLEKVLNHAESPLLAIIGGAKVSSKIEVIENLMDRVDEIIVGGGMAFTFIKSMGGKVGNSLVEDGMLNVAQGILEKAKVKGVKIWLPDDMMIADKFDNNAESKEVPANEIPDGWMGLDIGSKTIKAYCAVVERAKTILWNGPMGVFEMSNFEQGTKVIGEKIAEVTSKGCYSLVGGGDSVAAAKKYQLTEKMSYVSTGGGAMLEYLEGKELPGIQAIRNLHPNFL